MSSRRVRYAKKLAERIDRRRFAKGMGVGLIAAPFLNLLLEEPVKALPGQAKRVIFILTNGTYIPGWKMTGSSDQEIVTNNWNAGL
ncbi:MAG: hypothetical protein MK135_07115, partial [Polyangiaceae bacterium]|nr:hypothetical protein [Polyangiaceae bacterium]